MAPKRKGTGAFYTVTKRFLHPSRAIDNCAAFFHVTEIKDLIITARGEEKLKTGRHPVIYYRHESLPGIRLYAHIRYGNVTMEGMEDGFFELPVRAPRRSRGNNATGGRNNGTGGTGDADGRTETEET